MADTKNVPFLWYAQPQRARSRWIAVLVSGVITTGLTLGGAWWMDRYTKGDFNLFGFWVDAFLPVGALIVGILSASGYAAAAYLLGCRVRKPLLLAIIALTLCAYVVMEYIQFKMAGPLVFASNNHPVSFLQFYDLETRSIQFKDTDAPPQTPNPNVFPGQAYNARPREDPGLGAAGYLVRAGEVLAFSGGALVIPMVVSRRRYCEACERFYEVIGLGVIPSSVKVKKQLGIFSPRRVKLEGEHALAKTAAVETLRKLTAAIQAGDFVTFRQIVADLKPGSKAATKLPQRVSVQLSRCHQCGQGILLATRQTGLNGQTRQRESLIQIQLEPAIADQISPRMR
jgi:hypothetical protein